MKRNLMLISLAALVTALAPTARSQDLNQGQSSQQAPATGQAKPATGQAGQPGTPAPAVPTADERNAYNAIQHEIDPARQAQLVDDFAKKYPSSQLLSDAYFFGAYAYQSQGNVTKAVDYGEKSLVANDTNLRSLLLLAELLPQPQELQGSDADKEKKLTEAESDANKALAQVADLKLAPNTPADQAANIKSTITAQAHASLGMVHLQRATMSLTGTDPQELDKAEQEYKTAVSVPKPNAEDYFRLGEAYRMDKKFDDAIDAFTQCSKLSQGNALQGMADGQVQEVKKEKAQAPAAAPAPAPKP